MEIGLSSTVCLPSIRSLSTVRPYEHGRSLSITPRVIGRWQMRRSSNIQGFERRKADRTAMCDSNWENVGERIFKLSPSKQMEEEIKAP